MSNDTNTRRRQRYQTCNKCGGIYQAVLRVEGAVGERDVCGCRVRIVPTPEELAEVDAATDDDGPTCAGTRSDTDSDLDEDVQDRAQTEEVDA